MTETLQKTQELLQSVDFQHPDASLWRQAGHHYEAALFGAQVLALWVSWLDFAKVLYLGSTLDVEWILTRVWDAWSEMRPVLEDLQSRKPSRIEDAARTLQSSLPEWSDALYAWGKEARNEIKQGQKELQALLLIQAAFDLATMRYVAGPLVGRARAFAFTLPGIGGITASGAATGIRVVISAEWLEAMRHLIAIGAITTVEVAKIAGVSSVAASGPNPAKPSVLHMSGQRTQGTAGQPSATSPSKAQGGSPLATKTGAGSASAKKINIDLNALEVAPGSTSGKVLRMKGQGADASEVALAECIVARKGGASCARANKTLGSTRCRWFPGELGNLFATQDVDQLCKGAASQDCSPSE